MLMLSRLRNQQLIRQASSANFVEKAYALIDEAHIQSAKVEEVNKAWLKKENDLRLPKQLYKHPYCTKEVPLTLNPDDTAKIMLEISGPEQVSPHYESFMEFGKWYNYFFLGVIFSVSMRSHHNHAFGFVTLNMQYGFELWVYCFFYYYLKANVMIVPNPWKMLWEDYNLDQLIFSVYEVLENNALETRKPSVAQIDYLRVHLEYLGTKAKLLETHLANSRLQLKKHTYERAISILKSAERFEKDNLSSLLRGVLDQAVEKLSNDLHGPDAKDIRRQAFQSALIGIRKGKMTYENEPLLPRLLAYIEEFKTKAEALTEKEQAELIGLTKDQKLVISSIDKKIEQAFVHGLPDIKHPKILASSKFQSLSV
jgi:hypothetical protein